MTLAPRGDGPTLPADQASGVGAITPAIRGSDPSRATAVDEPKPRLVDDPERYELITEHARGGLGRIVRAVDRRLGRTVAVKELLRRNDATNEARFLREALITARLEHPGIVPVHEAGRWPNGEPYYVMKLVEGRTLKELIAEHPTLRERLALLPHVIAVADAVGYAHSEGVIHRDLKPSNVVVGEFGETIVVDWGLACDRKHQVAEPDDDVLASSSLAIVKSGSVSTVSGKVIGTPAYMAPEQARGEAVDERADVYAIGALLYEVLAGAAPHADTTPQATLDRVLAGPPRPLGEVAHVPSELATIVAKAMARDAAARYPNASALAEDLRRFQTGKLVRAHSYTALSRLRKKLSQHRGVAAVAISSVLALGVLGVTSFRRVVAERNIANEARAHTEAALASSEQRKHALVLLQAETALPKDPTATLAWLKLSLASSSSPENERNTIVDLVDEAVAEGVARHVFRPGDWVFDAMFTPDGQRVVAAVRDGTLRAYDLASGAEHVLGKAPTPMEVMAMSPDGELVLSMSVGGEVYAWSVRGAWPMRAIARAPSTTSKFAYRLTFAPDGQRVRIDMELGAPLVLELGPDFARTLARGLPVDLTPVSTVPGVPSLMRAAVANSDWTRQVAVTAWNEITAVDGDRVRPIAQTDKAIQFLALSPHGTQVVVADGATLWALPFAGGAMRPIGKYDGGRIVDVSWSPDERSFAVISTRPDITLVDAATLATRELRGHTDALYNVQWTRDGHRLLSGSDDGTARVWTIADGSSIVLRGHEDDVYHARFSADETQVVTSSLDATVRVWTLDRPGQRVFAEGASIDSLTVERDTAQVNTATTVSRWDLATGEHAPLWSWAADPKSLGIGVASPDGAMLLEAASDWSMQVRRKDATSLVLRGHKQAILHVEFSKDSKWLYSSSHDGTLRRWDMATGATTVVAQSELGVRAFAVDPRGGVVAEVGDRVVAFGLDGSARELGQGDAWCAYNLAFDGVGRLMLSRCDRSFGVVADDGHLVVLPTDGYSVIRAVASPDGARLVGGMSDRSVRVWDARTGALLHVLRGHTDLVMDVAVSPDGKLIASASYDKTVRVWDPERDLHRVLRGHSGAVTRVAWHGPSELVTGSQDGTVRVWEVPPLSLPTPTQLATRLAAATSARIDADRPATGTL